MIAPRARGLLLLSLAAFLLRCLLLAVTLLSAVLLSGGVSALHTLTTLRGALLAGFSGLSILLVASLAILGAAALAVLLVAALSVLVASFLSQHLASIEAQVLAASLEQATCLPLHFFAPSGVEQSEPSLQSHSFVLPEQHVAFLVVSVFAWASFLTASCFSGVCAEALTPRAKRHATAKMNLFMIVFVRLLILLS